MSSESEPHESESPADAAVADPADDARSINIMVLGGGMDYQAGRDLVIHLLDAVGAGAVTTAASVVVKAKIEKGAEVRKAEIEAETKRLEIQAETDRVQVHEASETERERIRQQQDRQPSDARSPSEPRPSRWRRFTRD